MAPRAPELPPYQRPTFTRNASSQSKVSVPSISQSNEADDEQSLSSDQSLDMESNDSQPHYEGEDTRLTSDKELRGFYMYGWAAEVFVVCGIGSFIPVTLEQLARENGVLLSDPSMPCKATKPTGHPSFSFSTNALEALLKPNPEKGQCVVHILGVEINTASFAMYTFSISVLIQALLIISMSGAADHGRFRKTFLLWFAFVGSIATMLFLPVVPKVYLLGALLAIISNTCFGASFVLLNSFLPLMVRFHPTVKYADSITDTSYADEEDEPETEEDDERGGETPTQENIIRGAQYANQLGEREGLLDEVADATTALLPSNPSAADLTIPRAKSRAAPSVELALATKISSYGIAIGYIAALLVQTLGILIVIAFQSSNFGLRLVLFVIGAWWFVFTLPTARWLRPRPGPPLHIGAQTSNFGSALAYFTYSWKSLGRTATHARHLKDVLLFLAAWFLLSDSIATVSGTAVLFAKTTLGMSYAMLALINVIATVFGVLGAFLWSRLSAFFRLSPTQTILLCITLFEVIPIYGLLGYIPAVQRLGYLGLQQQWEMYPLGAVYGFVLGGLSSYCRALFGELIPPGYEAAFYALYAITDKGSSVFGPAIVGAITDAYGEIRPAFWFLAILVGLPFPIMMLVNVDRGRTEGAALAKTLEELSRAQDARQIDEDDDNLSQEIRDDLRSSFSYQRS
ncbi:Autophagy-related protein 22-2 [Alternaria arborescens]|uniref:Autophagy-related protein n=1 Tax=Alternaria arborescens TaxID=156630 RepID=A0A4Q4SMH8_9PLEO|nr:Autophagy-related protein 22-2 [Alternaria arborescens]OWY44260.1 MFS general substrate transporter [Alternaria alternata]RYN32911.1 Autophagy-related protein 22-2 [Alternaria arborescens]RYO42720.1 Autophagy-related protein 22-2 [Alternaria arborescens]RYO71443.1 Autophagy-related protein 22-2 [Alternaria arborescens]